MSAAIAAPPQTSRKPPNTMAIVVERTFLELTSGSITKRNTASCKPSVQSGMISSVRLTSDSAVPYCSAVMAIVTIGIRKN